MKHVPAQGAMGACDLSTIGAKFLVEPTGPVLTDDEREILAELRPVSIAFRKRNFVQDVPYPEWLAAFRHLLKEIHTVCGHERMITTIDHEGGRVHRFPPPVTNFPYQAVWGAQTREISQAILEEIRSCGINLLFGPVVDIHSNSDNPVINQRAFGRTPEEVIAQSALFLDEAEKSGVLCCIKHFPGHGDTAVDSHFELPSLPFTIEQLATRELAPFKAAIERGVPAVMTAHLALPQIDPKHIATLSKVLLNDVLRTQLGFRGVIMADALGMEAIINLLDDPAAHAAAAEATLDLYLVMGDRLTMQDARRWAVMIRELIQDGAIQQRTITDSVARIHRLRDTVQRFEPREIPSAELERHATLAAQASGNSPWSNFHFSVPGFE